MVDGTFECDGDSGECYYLLECTWSGIYGWDALRTILFWFADSDDSDKYQFCAYFQQIESFLQLMNILNSALMSKHERLRLFSFCCQEGFQRV